MALSSVVPFPFCSVRRAAAETIAASPRVNSFAAAPYRPSLIPSASVSYHAAFHWKSVPLS